MEALRSLIAALRPIAESKQDPRYSFTINRLKILVAHLDEMNVLDFHPAAQEEFLDIMADLHPKANRPPHLGPYELKNDATNLLPLLDRTSAVLQHYQGKDAHLRPRDFSFIASPDYRRMIERDAMELETRLIPSGSWKSAIVLAGSIVEAVLQDLLTGSEENIRRACDAVKKADGSGPSAGDLKRGAWTFELLILAARTVAPKLVTAELTDQIKALKDYRNLIHPGKEQRKQGTLDLTEGAAKGALATVLQVREHFARAAPAPQLNTP